MAQNTASKYSSKVDERFKLKELTGTGLNTDYEWNDVDEIKVYSINTVPLDAGQSRAHLPEWRGSRGYRGVPVPGSLQ